MDIKDLDPNERAALVAVLRVGLLSDNQLTDNEEVAFVLLRDQWGEEAYHAAAQAARERAYDQASLRALLMKVTRSDARDVIYGTLLQFAASETIDSREARVLDLVGALWDIQPKFEDFPSEES